MQGLNVAYSFHSQNRSSRKKRSRFFPFCLTDTHIYIYICTNLCVDVYVCMCIHETSIYSSI